MNHVPRITLILAGVISFVVTCESNIVFSQQPTAEAKQPPANETPAPPQTPAPQKTEIPKTNAPKLTNGDSAGNSLLDDLTSGLLESTAASDAKKKETSPSQPKEKTADVTDPNSMTVDLEQILETLTIENSSAADSPLQIAKKSMMASAKYLGQGDTGVEPQELQNEAMRQLDQLIADLRRQNAQQTSKSSSSQSQEQTSQQQQSSSKPQPADQSDESQSEQQSAAGGDEDRSKRDDDDENSNGQGGRGNPNADGNSAPRDSTVLLDQMRQLQTGIWGQLPQPVRQQMQGAVVEKFLPKYEAEIREYYRRLAEQGKQR